MEFGNNSPARLTLQCYDKKAIIEWNGSDITVNEVLDGIYSIMVAQGWLPESIINGMKEFVDEKYTEE